MNIRAEQIRKRLKEINQDDRREWDYQDQLDVEREELEMELSNIEEQRIDVTVMGSIIGTASGWDEMDSDCLCFYDFEVSSSFKPLLNKFKDNKAESISVNFTTGLVEAYEGSVVLWSGNLSLAC
jgi:hypothetical protein